MEGTTEAVEVMIAKWTEYNNLWYKADGIPASDRSYVLSYSHNAMVVDPREDHLAFSATTCIVSAYLALDDELNNATLVGIFEQGEMVHLVSEIDTQWGSVWRAEYGTAGEFTGTLPDTKEGE